MDLRLRCPGCEATLSLPAAAAGHAARCPSCRITFKVPQQEAAVEETISSWIEEDVDQMQDELQDQWARRAAEEAHKRVTAERARLEKNVEKIEKYFASPEDAAGGGQGPGTAPGGQRSRMPGAPIQHRPTMRPTPAAVGRKSPTARQQVAAAAAARPETPVSSPQPAEPVAVPEPPQPEPFEPENSSVELTETVSPVTPGWEPVTDEAAPILQESGDYPTNLFVEHDTPHLVVGGCGQDGVLMVFDSAFLKHQGFRLSMPLGCAFSNDRDRNELVARPLAFYDQSQGKVRSPQDVEAGHEHHLLEGQTPEDVITLIGRLEHLPTPFHLPMPYYVNTEHANANMSLECYTERRGEDQGTSCLVLIPHGRYALQWLVNVNGVCGREYSLLASDVEALWSEEWAGVSEMTRRRLGTWVDFAPGERFQFYVNDAEFGLQDEGLAGMVLTDQRLIYHKYHRHGSISFDEHPELSIQPDGDFAALTVKTVTGRAKAARFRLRDLEPLIDAISQAGLALDMSRV